MGPRTHFALRILAKGKFLRGTSLDPFGHTKMRRLERKLCAHYEAMIRHLIQTLSFDSYETTLAAASAADLVRGYEEVKLRNAGLYVQRLRELGVDTSALAI
jgi:indolepyruvate ferredoxin oxidoreductase